MRELIFLYELKGELLHFLERRTFVISNNVISYIWVYLSSAVNEGNKYTHKELALGCFFLFIHCIIGSFIFPELFFERDNLREIFGFCLFSENAGDSGIRFP